MHFVSCWLDHWAQRKEEGRGIRYPEWNGACVRVCMFTRAHGILIGQEQ